MSNTSHKATRYKMQVFAVYTGYEQLTATKRFNTFSLAKRYMTALRARYDGDEFACQVFDLSAARVRP